MLRELQSAKTLSAFQRRVLSVTATIPCGMVTTYSALAAFVECTSPRAVGQALQANPLSPQIPCHRVVRSDGSLGGFFGSTSGNAIERKTSLLVKEGITFDESGRVEERFILRDLRTIPARHHS